MKLSTSVSSVETSGLAESMDFSIKVTGKAFKILLDGLYADKVAAVIRELSTNAYDAHLAIGKGDLPFNVHLPTLFAPTFIVRDFGVSMSHEQTMRLMSTVFDSTKDDSNNQVGAFGLGSKSPFALVDTFSLNVIKDGEKRMYSAFVGPNGVPTIALLGQEKTTDPQGVEFQMSIAPKDVAAFRTRALRILRWFPTLPKVYEGGRLVDITPPPFIVNGSGWQLIDTSKWPEQNHAYARQGCVVYPLDRNSIPSLSPEHSSILASPIVIDFAIGTIDVAASREALSYEPQTCKNIVARLNSVIAEVTDKFGKAIKDAPTLWEAGVKRQALHNESKLPRHLVHAIAATKWKGTIPVTSFDLGDVLEKMKKAGTLPADFKCYGWDSWRIRRSSQTVAMDDYSQRGAESMHWEYGRDGLCIFFTEEAARPTHEGKRIRAYTTSPAPQMTLLFVVKDDAQRVAILDALGNPPDAGWTKDLASPVVPPRAPAPKRGVTKKVEVKVRELVTDPLNPQKFYRPEAEKVVQLDGDAYYAIQREGRIRDLGTDNNSADPAAFFEGLTHAKLSGFMPTDGFPIYLISSTYQKRVETFGKWKKIDGYIAAQFTGYEDKLVAELEQRNISNFLQGDRWVALLTSSQTKGYATLASQLAAGPLHDLSNVVKAYSASNATTASTPTRYYDGLRTLRFFGLEAMKISDAAQKRLQASKALKELNDASSACVRMYPLISSRDFYDLSRASSMNACLEYIEALDKLRADKAAARAAAQAAITTTPAPGP